MFYFYLISTAKLRIFAINLQLLFIIFRCIMIIRYQTPDGFDDLLMCSDGEMLTGLGFEGSREDVKCKRFNPVETMCTSSLPPVLKNTIRWLDIYFSGCQPDFTPAYRMENLTPFRQEVMELLSEIPYGNTLTYGEIASAIAKKHGIPKMSAQAVGGAVGWNPIGIIVPCHRVVGANGNLTGYGGGMKNKVALLRLEGHEMDSFVFLQSPK